MTVTQLSFAQKVANHWTPERIRKVTSGKKYIVEPVAGGELLRALGLLNSDASMPADAVRKYAQINHMIGLLEPTIKSLSERFSQVRILDCGCGNSYLTLLLAWCFKHVWNKSAVVVGIDTRNDVIAKSAQRARDLGLADILQFEAISVGDYAARRQQMSSQDERKSSRPHFVVALHACDTATDDALALAFDEKADAFAVAPCCQAELAGHWRRMSAENFKNAFSVLVHSPELRRDSCSTFTDAMRVLLARGSGYEVTTTEFVPSAHTPKNRLISGVRRGNFLESALSEYADLSKALGASIRLSERLPSEVAEKLNQKILR
ncbi:MAG: class I SAM-dependent methyltransferase [Silvanigrellaceae bacterium]